ncbi:MAG TPA: M23 family metallopeptidase [Dehalococcoidia bacterium]
MLWLPVLALVLLLAGGAGRLLLDRPPEARYAPPRAVPAPPQVALSATAVAQGTAAVVTLTSPDVTEAVARFQDESVPMVRSGTTWWAVLPAGMPVGSAAFPEPASYRVVVNYRLAEPYDWRFDLATVTVTPTAFPVDAVTVTGSTAGLLAPELAQQEAATLQQVFSRYTREKLWQGGLQLPVRGPVTTEFGARRSYNGGPATGGHSGMDIAAGEGTPVAAAADGVVAWTGELPQRGRYVVLDHGGGVFTAYGHLSAIRVAPEQRVTAGQHIGDVGSTGLSTGPHLHWELVIRGRYVDPAAWLGTDPFAGTALQPPSSPSS